MAKILDGVSRTFSEYLLVPRLTKRQHIPANVSLRAPIAKFDGTAEPRLSLNLPFVSASMQSVSGVDMAIALARQGALAFVYCSQPVEKQAEMISRVKLHKAGFVASDSNVKPDATLAEAIAITKATGHSTVAVTDDGTSKGTFVGILTDKDFWEFEDDLNDPVSAYMTSVEHVVHGTEGMSLDEANAMLRKHKKECLPILDKKGRLQSLVFKKDYVDHRKNPNELLDAQKRLVVGAGINTHDYRDRVPALLEAGADVLSFDSSDGYSEFQREAARWIRERYGDAAVLGGGNVVSGEAFDYLVRDADVDFVKVGIGGGSICITREQKGIGRGQASALLDVIAARDRHLEKTGVYVPVCSDGGLANDTQIILALAMGADLVMMGRYFAMTDESPTPRVSIGGRVYKPYWGEGSNRARNWQRYSTTGEWRFEEGIDAYVPIVGPVKDVLGVTSAKLRSTMCNMGASTLRELAENVVLTRISEQSFVEGGTSNVLSLDKDQPQEV
ncbi:MAG: IMP dehydrogenase [Chitinivibrionales bacterium]|nr:IMP dehydrogenase [Chitinivibrionales bacterium]MBD3394683.1 IMP dehydrogenase [Chitinivibrionales bacterium]